MNDIQKLNCKQMRHSSSKHSSKKVCNFVADEPNLYFKKVSLICDFLEITERKNEYDKTTVYIREKEECVHACV